MCDARQRLHKNNDLSFKHDAAAHWNRIILLDGIFEAFCDVIVHVDPLRINAEDFEAFVATLIVTTHRASHHCVFDVQESDSSSRRMCLKDRPFASDTSDRHPASPRSLLHGTAPFFRATRQRLNGRHCSLDNEKDTIVKALSGGAFLSELAVEDNGRCSE